jgi:hypothetical protein
LAGKIVETIYGDYSFCLSNTFREWCKNLLTLPRSPAEEWGLDGTYPNLQKSMDIQEGTFSFHGVIILWWVMNIKTIILEAKSYSKDKI